MSKWNSTEIICLFSKPVVVYVHLIQTILQNESVKHSFLLTLVLGKNLLMNHVWNKRDKWQFEAWRADICRLMIVIFCLLFFGLSCQANDTLCAHLVDRYSYKAQARHCCGYKRVTGQNVHKPVKKGQKNRDFQGRTSNKVCQGR